MKNKISLISMILLTLAILVTPVMAQGPLNAVDKNQHAVLDTTKFGTDVLDLNLPSGVTHRWFGNEARIKVKYAGEDGFYCPKQIDVGDNWFGWIKNPNNRGKWVHMNKGDAATLTGYLGMFAGFGLTPPNDVPDDGVYIWGSKLQ